MPALGLRTIWIALRAVNYTDAAFRGALINIENLQKSEIKLANATMQSAIKGSMAGLMWMTFGTMLAQAGMEMARTTSTLKPFVNAVDKLFGIMGENESMKVFISLLLFAVSAFSIFGGAAMMINAILLLKTIPIVWSAVMAFGSLAMVVATAFITFMLMYEIFKKLPPVIGVVVGAILLLCAAIIFLRALAGDIGVIWAVAAGAAAVGAFAGAFASATGKFQMGTRSVGATGLALVHKHEVIYNPTTNRPTQVGNDLNRGAGETNFYDMPVTIETVNTQAKIEDLDEKLSGVWRRRMRRRR